jgi:cyclohexadieny/prephenate dehydrogenase
MTHKTPLIPRLAIIGMGLIGSSIVRAAKLKGVVGTISVSDASAAVRMRVSELNIADEVHENAADAVQNADLVILCVPVGVMPSVAQSLAASLKSGAILSDVGSVKTTIQREIAPFLHPDVHFIPAHPVAGTEYSGPDAGFATIFENRWCILTPSDENDAAAVSLLQKFWEGLGSLVETMSAEHHDLVLAITSHVPHLIAYNIVGTAADLEAVTQSEVIKFSAGGFRDFTRIASSDPTMWRDVFLNNKEAVLEVLGRFTEDLSALQRMIRWGDGDGLFELFTRTREIRRGIVALGQEKN